MELLLASLMEETPKMEELDIEEEIRQIRIRGERMASMYANNKYNDNGLYLLFMCENLAPGGVSRQKGED